MLVTTRPGLAARAGAEPGQRLSGEITLGHPGARQRRTMAIILAHGRPAIEIVQDGFTRPEDPWAHLGDPDPRAVLQAAISAVVATSWWGTRASTGSETGWGSRVPGGKRETPLPAHRGRSKLDDGCRTAGVLW